MTHTAPSPADGRAFTEVVNRRTGQVHAHGHLTVQGADLLSGTVEGLLTAGHRCVVVDLGDVDGADLTGLTALTELATRVAASGRSLRIRGDVLTA